MEVRKFITLLILSMLIFILSSSSVKCIGVDKIAALALILGAAGHGAKKMAYPMLIPVPIKKIQHKKPCWMAHGRGGWENTIQHDFGGHHGW